MHVVPPVQYIKAIKLACNGTFIKQRPPLINMSAKGTPQLSRPPHWAQFTNLPRWFFLTIGVLAFQNPDQTPTPRTSRRNVLLIALFIVSFVNTALCVAGEYVFFAIAIRSPDMDAEMLTSLLLCIGYIMLSFAKVFTIWLKRPELDAVMRHFDALWPRSLTAQRHHRVDMYIAQANQLMRTYAYIQMIMIWFFNFFPIASITLYRIAGGGLSQRLEFPYPVWYPFDERAPVIFELTYVSQFWAAYFSAVAILGADMLLCSLVVQLCMHYDALAAQLCEYRPVGGGRADAAQLRRCVQLHDRLLGIGHQLDGIFGVCVLFNVLSSIVILCMLAFLVLTAGISMAVVKYMMTLVTCTGQIYMVCLLGEKCVDAVSI